MFSCEFCKTSKKGFLTEDLWATASVIQTPIIRKIIKIEKIVWSLHNLLVNPYKAFIIRTSIIRKILKSNRLFDNLDNFLS